MSKTGPKSDSPSPVGESRTDGFVKRMGEYKFDQETRDLGVNAVKVLIESGGNQVTKGLKWLVELDKQELQRIELEDKMRRLDEGRPTEIIATEEQLKSEIALLMAKINPTGKETPK